MFGESHRNSEMLVGSVHSSLSPTPSTVDTRSNTGLYPSNTKIRISIRRELSRQWGSLSEIRPDRPLFGGWKEASEVRNLREVKEESASPERVGL
jgi:hypothetical protein